MASPEDLKAYEQKDQREEVSPIGVERVWNAMFDAVTDARRPLVIPGIREISSSVWTPAADKMWSGESTPEEVCREITAGSNRILDTEWAKM